MTVMVLGAFIGFVWLAHRSIRGTRPAYVRFSTPAQGALARAKRRLHAGEITAEEYARIAVILHM